MQPVSPEEVFLCVLAELIVNPPAEDEETGSSLNQGRVARQLSVLILKQIKTRSSACYPTLTQLIDTIREQLPDAGAEIVRGLALRLSQLESPDDVQSLFLHISSMLLDPSKPPPPVAREDAIGEQLPLPGLQASSSTRSSSRAHAMPAAAAVLPYICCLCICPAVVLGSTACKCMLPGAARCMAADMPITSRRQHLTVNSLITAPLCLPRSRHRAWQPHRAVHPPLPRLPGAHAL